MPEQPDSYRLFSFDDDARDWPGIGSGNSFEVEFMLADESPVHPVFLDSKSDGQSPPKNGKWEPLDVSTVPRGKDRWFVASADFWPDDNVAPPPRLTGLLAVSEELLPDGRTLVGLTTLDLGAASGFSRGQVGTLTVVVRDSVGGKRKWLWKNRVTVHREAIPCGEVPDFARGTVYFVTH